MATVKTEESDVCNGFLERGCKETPLYTSSGSQVSSLCSWVFHDIPKVALQDYKAIGPRSPSDRASYLRRGHLQIT